MAATGSVAACKTCETTASTHIDLYIIDCHTLGPVCIQPDGPRVSLANFDVDAAKNLIHVHIFLHAVCQLDYIFGRDHIAKAWGTRG